MTKLYRYTLLLVLSSFLISCTKDFEEINTNPNLPKEITPGVTLGQLQYRLVNASINGAYTFNHELMQVTAPRASSSGGGIHRYVINPGAGVWNNFYTSFTDLGDIYSASEKIKENNYMGIALIYKSWAFSILTDLYGDIPYSEATQGINGNYKAKFDKQKDIYTQILKDLETANTLLDDTKALTFGGDLLYNANTLDAARKNAGILRYKKFANSLKLRLLLRISKRDGEINVTEQINTILNNPTLYPVFTSNADEAIFKYPGTFPYYNPYFNARTLDWRDGTYYTKFFLDKMVTDADPRRILWARTTSINGANVYRGIESGYPTTAPEYKVNENSNYTDVLKTLPQLGVMMTYAEVEFIKAELALKGFSTGKTVKQHYDSGITASMTQWGVIMPANYLAQAGVVYNAAAVTERQLEQIMLQKYYAYFFVDYQSWFEKRRTGYPSLPRNSGIPTENKFPSRIPYPTYLQSLNPDNLTAAVTAMGGDNSDIKVWWDK
jgi:hypothetical protein